MVNSSKTIQYCNMCDAPLMRDGNCKRCSVKKGMPDNLAFACSASDNNVRCRSDKKLMRINQEDPAQFFCDYHYQKHIDEPMWHRKMAYYRNREAPLTDLHPGYARLVGEQKEPRKEAQATIMQNIIEERMPGYSNFMKRVN